MLKIIKLPLFLSLVILLTQCKPDPLPVLNLSASEVNVQNTNGTAEISVSSNDQWVTQITGSWLSITPTSSKGDAVVKITAQNNFTTSERSASVIFTMGQEGKKNYLRKIVTVKQSFSQLSIDKNYLNFEKDQGSVTVKITSNTSWTISIPAESTWLTVNSASGTSSADVVFSVSAKLVIVYFPSPRKSSFISSSRSKLFVMAPKNQVLPDLRAIVMYSETAPFSTLVSFHIDCTLERNSSPTCP